MTWENKYFKSYSELKNKYETFLKQNNNVSIDDVNKIKDRLNKGILGWSNKQSKFRKIMELFCKDKWAFLEKRRLLSLYQWIWGSSEWNQVQKDNVERSSKDTIDKVKVDPNLTREKDSEFPKSIRTKLNEINQKHKEKEDIEDPNTKFLNALTKPYSELDPRDRLEVYECDWMVKRNIILKYQWQKMDTLWFQQNTLCQSSMKKISNDVEIESDLDQLYEALNATQNQRNIPEKSKNLFRIS